MAPLSAPFLLKKLITEARSPRPHERLPKGMPAHEPSSENGTSEGKTSDASDSSSSAEQIDLTPAQHYEVYYSIDTEPFTAKKPSGSTSSSKSINKEAQETAPLARKKEITPPSPLDNKLPSTSPVTHHQVLNDMIGKSITLQWNGEIYCVHCGRRSKKSFNQGYCYVCFTKLARNDICSIKPELCHFHKKTCREEDWALKHCFIPHTVYLALSDKLKVGITRHFHEKHRWMDQGAFLAMPIARAGDRFSVGRIEVRLKSLFNDKTFWRNMLLNLPTQAAIEAGTTLLQKSAPEALATIETALATDVAERQSLSTKHIENAENSELEEPVLAVKPLALAEALASIHYFHYPLSEPPPNFHSFSFEKTPVLSDTLLGIKGQYLIFRSGVLNVRKFAGYLVQATFPA